MNKELDAAMAYAGNNATIDDCIILQKHSDKDTTAGNAYTILSAEVRRLQADKRRIDWLSDRNNTLGQVLLPTACVVENPSDMRAAIDMAMGLSCAEKESKQ